MVKKPSLNKLPVSLARLQQHRLNCAKFIRPGWSGAHLTRRRGSSLDFRELQQYQIGDDLRHIDWHASARQGGLWLGVQSWLKRRFEADEQLTVALSLDTRATMWLPGTERQSISKLQIGAWACEALAAMVLFGKNAGDRVILHRLYGGSRRAAAFSGGHSLPGIARELRQLVGTSREDTDQTNLRSILPYLPPTAVWIVFTDLYFKDDPRLITQLIEARKGNRWVILVELDSWPFERHLLTDRRPGQILGPGQVASRMPINPDSIAAAEARLNGDLTALRTQLKNNGISLPQRWSWPEDGHLNLQNWLFETKEFQNLFKRESW